ncbi:MAG: hypothetical protein Q9182_005341 [Xanthomendoza sp. 2 TL-2023]
MPVSPDNVAGWCEEDDERLIACAYHIRSADAGNIAKFISVWRDRLVVAPDILARFDYIHDIYHKWNEHQVSRSATGSVKEPPSYNVVHFWAVLWSDEEERRSPKHEEKIIVFKMEYDWAMDNWSEFNRIQNLLFSGKKPSPRYSPKPSACEGCALKLPEDPARRSVLEDLIQPLYQFTLSCPNKRHQEIVKLGNRPFFIHQWDNPIKIGEFPKKHQPTSGDIQLIRTYFDYEVDLLSLMMPGILYFVWEYIKEYLPWEEPPPFTDISCQELNRRDIKKIMDELFKIAQSDNTEEKKQEMWREARLDGSNSRVESQEEKKQRRQLIEELQLEFKAHNARRQQSTLSKGLDKLKSKVKGRENVKDVHCLSGVVQPPTHKNKSQR